MGKKTSNKLLIAIIACLTVCIAGGFMFAFLPSYHQKDTPAPTTVATDETTRQTVSGSSTHSRAPSDKGNGHTVYIETGHGREDNGNWDGGCTWSDGSRTYEEASIMLPIAKATVDHLRKAGFTVYTDADDDNNMNLAETFDFLDEHREVEAFVNLHCDWSEAESGTMPLYRTDEQLVLAKALNEGVHTYVDMPDRGETYRDDLKTLTSEKVHCPAVLFETGSIKADNRILTEEYESYGKGIAKGICSYFDVEFPE